MKKLYKGEYKIPRRLTYEIPAEVLEKKFIFDFLESLPVDKLKKLINFKQFDCKDKNIWGDSREDSRLYDLLCQLRREDAVLYRTEILLDGD